MRDNHLRSPDFFDCGSSSDMTFASTSVRCEGEAWILTGDLTIKSVTRPLELEVEFLGVDPTGLQGETRIGFAAKGAIQRSDFNINFGLTDTKIVIADRIDIVLDVEAVLET